MAQRTTLALSHPPRVCLSAASSWALAARAEAIDYDDFKIRQASSYGNVENRENKYVIYYYDSDSEYSEDVKSNILTFFEEFTLLDFYLVDVDNVDGATTLSGLTSPSLTAKI